ncbi:MAG: 3-oxoacyl-[acyl-carrier-protein] synthase III C-terminal domain-containing protein [Spirochaetota bacterium]|nr:3-oxoacyl-[acyl-carrier-protein] synthase III C-terminal domain-containing protein [Spirochaetota bacterium]
MVGIRSYGGYIPRYRLNRGTIFKSMGWINQANMAYARGEKAVANVDEDSLTMAVAASLDCIGGFNPSEMGGVYFASTTFPYKERQNAGIISGALRMNDNVRTADFAGSLKSGTTALISAIEAVSSNGTKDMVVCASDCRLGKMGSPQELIMGDGAAAFLVSDKDVIAEYKGSYSLSCDFVDHYRGSFAKFDRQWEDRWIRDEGFDKFIPEVVNGLLNKCNMKMDDIAKVIYPCYYAREHQKLAKMFGLGDGRVQDTMLGEVGEMGTAQPMVMLAKALEDANPGDKLLVVSFGSGCDAICFEVTNNIKNLSARTGVSGSLANKAELDRYEKYLTWRGIIDADIGLRGEEDVWARWSVNWRNRKTILGFIGSKCKKCGTPQLPPQQVCANPECGAIDQMEDYNFADKTGKIFSYTGDNLAASMDPPQLYGNIDFDGGGRFTMSFTDCTLESIAVGMPMKFSFRIVYYDEKRDLTIYFWKAVPK